MDYGLSEFLTEAPTHERDDVDGGQLVYDVETRFTPAGEKRVGAESV